jgi:hypothetical protein
MAPEIEEDAVALPRSGFHALLGPFAELRVRESLALTLGVEPSFASFDSVTTYRELRQLVREQVSTTSSCDGHECFSEDVWLVARYGPRTSSYPWKQCKMAKL